VHRLLDRNFLHLSGGPRPRRGVVSLSMSWSMPKMAIDILRSFVALQDPRHVRATFLVMLLTERWRDEKRDVESSGSTGRVK